MSETIAYCRTSAHEELLELSRNPYDLRQKGALTRGRLDRYIAAGRHFSLHYWAQRVDDRVLDGLQNVAEQCDLVSQFRAMKNGAVMNNVAGVESEYRQVLHTACRDIFATTPREKEATAQARRELTRLQRFLEKVDSGEITNGAGERFTTFIHIGIGGSDLGPRCVYEALKPFGRSDRDVLFIANVDPDDAAAVLARADLGRSLVCIVSKSGTTDETLTNAGLAKERFVAAGLDPINHFLSVTGQGSPMDDPDQYLQSFYMFDYIGGRFSATSMVGMVMLGFFLGYERALEFLRGAADVDGEAEREDIRSNPPLLQALLGLWNHSYLGMPTVAVLPYSQALHRFPAHLQQCDMESNGKSVNRQGKMVDYRTGPVVWGEVGTNGQHAFYQLLHQGTEAVPCEFIGFRRSQYEKSGDASPRLAQQKLVANMLAQSLAFAIGRDNVNPNKYFPGNRPSSILLAERLTPQTMGALLAFYEAKIIYQGFSYNINSFDQEGVQLGKELATRFVTGMTGGSDGEESLEKNVLEVCAMV